MIVNVPKKYIPSEDLMVIIKREEDEIRIEKENGESIGYLPHKLFKLDNGDSLFKRRKHFRANLKTDGSLNVVRYTPLHGHSGYSMLDGASKTADMAKVAEHAMALTDHGNMFGALDFYKEMKKASKKPILGFEAYSETIDGEKEGNHLLLLAENNTGYHNLVKLVSESNANKFGKFNYVTYENLQKYSEGIIATSACLAGELSQNIIFGRDEKALEIAQRMQEIFGKDNYFIEIQRHDLPEEKIVNPVLIDIAEQIGAGIVATSDSHYTMEEDREAQEVLMCLSTNDTMDNPDRFKLTGTGYHIHSSNEMAELFADMPEVLDNTLNISDRVNVSLETDEIHMPHIEVPEEHDSEDDYFESLCWEGFAERFEGTEMFTDENYKERLEFEMNVIKDMGFPGYFIIMWDVIRFANEQDILVGPGRGSACGSLVAYVLQITDVDPIPYGLLFERFLNPDRYSMPDIDTDFPNTRREEIIEYAREKYGEASVARIVTYSTLSAKRVTRDVTKVYNFPFSYGSKIAEAIPDRPGMTLDKAFEESPEFKRLYEEEEDAQKIIDISLELEGLPRNTSLHACFDEDTLVTTKDGLVRIADIKEGMEVMTHKNRYKPVVSTMITNTEEIYHLHGTSAFPLETTPNHPFLVREMTRKRDRSNGKDVSFKTYSEPLWKEASQLEVGKDYLGIPVNNESIIPNNDKYELPFDSTSFWWIVGRYLGDGWTEFYERTFKDYDYTEERVIICCTHKNESERETIEKHLKNIGFNYRVEKRATIYKIHIYKSDLYEYLQSFGRYAHGKKLNGDVINLPIELAKNVLLGYMSADGHYLESTERYSFKTVSKQLAIGISQLVNKVLKRPVHGTTIPARTEKIENRTVQSKEKYQVWFTLDTRKKERSYYDAENNYIWTRLKRVKIESKTKPMYNLTVLDDSSYVVHGVSVHNCGVIISPRPVNEYIPTFYAENPDTKTMQLTTQFDKDQVEEMGLLKMDFLGLKTLGVIEESIHLVNERRENTKEEPITMRTIPVDDTETYKNIQTGNTSGVFQLEGPGMTKTISSVLDGVQTAKTKNSEESLLRLIATLSLYRPGPMDEIPNYIKNMKNPDKVHYETPEMKNVLSETHGVIVYQEQVMQLVRDLAGFSRGQSDIVRKGMAKKVPGLMDEWGEAFIHGSEEKNIKGCVPNGIQEEVAKDIWDKMVKFSDYAFNKSHAAGYSFVSARTGWLATHYPAEFYAAMMNVFAGEKEKAQKYLATAKALGLPILQPSVNNSQERFSVEGDAIRFGLNGISHVGKTAANIIDERVVNGQYESMQDFAVRMVVEHKLTTRTLSNLILSGALDDFPGSRLEKSKALESFLELGKFIRDAKSIGRPTLFDIDGTINQTIFNPPMNNEEEMDTETLLAKEREIAGFYITGHPLTEYQIALQNDETRDNYIILSDLIDNIDEKIEKENKTAFRSNKRLAIAGVVTEVETYYTKRTGDPLKIFTLEDETGSIKCIAFSNMLQEKRGLFNENDLLYIEGNYEVDDGEVTFTVNSAEDLHAFKVDNTPNKFKIVGHKDRTEAGKQYKSVIKWATQLPDWQKRMKSVPVVFIKDEQEYDMGVRIPYSHENITTVREMVGTSSLKPVYG